MMPTDRYSRQVILPQVGKEGQRRLAAGKVLVVGCGGTGGAIAQYLFRAGIGKLTILDRDVVEESNLHRQLLFDPKDIGCPKAYIAADKLHAVNPETDVAGIAEDFSPLNAEKLVRESDLVMDGTDNMETRFVLNDACVKLGKPWIYVGAVSTYGMVAFLDASSGACLRCFLPNIPDAGTVPTCQTAGVLNTIPGIMGAMAATEAIRFLVGEKPSGKLVIFDAWSGQYNSVGLAKRQDCPCCGKRKFSFLEMPVRTSVTALCGSDSVQITPPKTTTLDLAKMAAALKRIGRVDGRELWLLFDDGKYRLTIFRNGRVLVSGTGDEKTARALYSKYIGN
jgi:molybdopterin/thiamine biosynthesis adenylyltransferase